MEKLRERLGPVGYEITVQGRLGDHWSHGFDGACIESQGSVTTITGQTADQSRLYGWLNRIHALGLSLISVKRL